MDIYPPYGGLFEQKSNGKKKQMTNKNRFDSTNFTNILHVKNTIKKIEKGKKKQQDCV